MKQMIVSLVVVVGILALAGCQQKPATPPPVAPVAPAAVDTTSPEGAGPAVTNIAPEPAAPRMPYKPTPPTPSAGAGATAGAGKTYTVQPHDTLMSIARKVYGDQSMYKKIAEANGITDANKISVGQVLKLP